MDIMGYIGIAAIVLICIILFYVVFWAKRGIKKLAYKVEKTSWKDFIVAVIEVVEKKLEEKDVIDIPLPREKKKLEIMSNSLKSFYYLDENQIQYLLPQIDTERLKLTKVEKSKSNSRNISAKTQKMMIEASAGNNKSNQTKETYEAKESSVVKMYQDIEDHLFSDNKVRFGLEDIPTERMEYGITLFKEKCNELKEFGYLISEQEQEAHVKKHVGQTAESMVEKISKKTGYIALQVDTELTEKNDEMYEFTYYHPINKYLPDDKKQPLKFKLLCIKENITQNGLAVLKKERKFNITAIGKITGWDDENRVLEITPISIY